MKNYDRYSVHRKRIITTFLFLIVAMQLLIVRIYSEEAAQPRKQEVFALEGLSHLCYVLMRLHGFEALVGQIDLRPPDKGEVLPLHSFLIADQNSEVTLEIDLLNEQIGLSSEEVMRKLSEDYFPMGNIHKGNEDGQFYFEAQGFFYNLLANLPSEQFLDSFEIKIAAYEGDVLISKDVEKISALLPKDFVAMRTAGRIIRADDASAKLATPSTLSEKEKQKTAMIGITFTESSAPGEASITDIIEGSLAQEAGLTINDVIVRVNGESFNDLLDLVNKIERGKEKGKISFLVRRDSQSKIFTFSLDGTGPQEHGDD